jgi:hypothetical protein
MALWPDSLEVSWWGGLVGSIPGNHQSGHKAKGLFYGLVARFSHLSTKFLMTSCTFEGLFFGMHLIVTVQFIFRRERFDTLVTSKRLFSRMKRLNVVLQVGSMREYFFTVIAAMP